MGDTHFRSRLLGAEVNAKTTVGKVQQWAGLPLGALDFLLSGNLTINNFHSTADFDATNDWTATETDAAATETLSDDASPSYLRLLNTAADNDVVAVMFTAAGGAGETWRLRANKKRFFHVRFRVGSATAGADTVEQCNIFLGLQKTNTDQFGLTTAVDDFIGFYKNDGSGLFYFVSGKDNNGVPSDGTEAKADVSFTNDNGTNCIVVSTGLTLAAADACDHDTGNQGSSNGVYHTLSFLLDISSTATTGDIYVFADGVHVATQRTTFGLSDDEELCPTFAIKNGTGVLRALDIDQFIMWQEQ
jgi:hypothetical protein